MRVRIVRRPQGEFSAVDLKNYRVGQVYDVPSTLAAYLVVEKFATYEMRDSPDRPDRKKRR